MEVIFDNKTKEELIIKIDKDEVETKIAGENQHKITKDEGEYEFKIISVNKDVKEKCFKFKSPSNIIFEGDKVFQQIGDEKVELVAIEKKEEQVNKIKSIPKEKEFKLFFEKLNKDEFVFLNNEKKTIYKFKELKYLPEKKVNAVLQNNKTNDEINVDCFKNKLSYFTRIPLKILHSDETLLEKYIIININSKMDSIYDFILDSCIDLTSSKDFRIIYKNKDISGRELNPKFFKPAGQEDEFEKTEEDGSEEDDDDDSEECGDEESIRTGSIDQSNTGGENSSESHTESKKNSKEDEKSKEISEKIEEKNDSKLDPKKYAEKNLIDLNFNFEKDNLLILVPQVAFRNFNLLPNPDDASSTDYRNREIVNVFVFSHNITIKNLLITQFNYGNSCSVNPELSLMIYETTLNPKDYMTPKENENDFSFENTDYDLTKIIDGKLWCNNKIIFEKKGINSENVFTEENELKKITDNSFVIETNSIKIDKNKVYAFVFNIGENREYYEFSYFYNSDRKFKGQEEDLLKMYGKSSYDSYFMIFGFNYKIQLGYGN